jgi:hypothetical protein
MNSPHHRTLAARWLASGKFTPEWLLDHLPTQIKVKVSTASPSFMYAEGAQQHLLQDDAATSFLQTMSPHDMLEQMKHQETTTPPQWSYYTGKCSDLSHQLLQAVPDWEQLRVEPSLSAAFGNPEAPSIWIGGPGTSTTCHYDVMDNVFVQLHGRKKFRLWGPEAFKDVHVFPDVHPRARKSQLGNVKELVQAIAPREEIVLEPGDTLHLPAFTFHQVEALDVSLSINVFSVCRTQMHGGRILAAPVPLVVSSLETMATEDSVDSTTERASAQLLRVMEHVLLPVFGIEMPPVEYITQHLLDTRHRSLVGSDSDSSGSDSGTRGKQDGAQRVGRQRGNVGLAATFTSELDMHRVEELKMWYAEMHQDLIKSGNYRDPVEINGVRDIIVCHLLESWALQLGDGDPELVHGTLESCVERRRVSNV